MKTPCHFTFPDGPLFAGVSHGTTWNGFDNVSVTPAVRGQIVAWLESIGDDAEVIDDLRTLPVGADGLVDLSGGYATEIVTLEELQKMADDARPRSDDDWGSAHQIEAENLFFQMAQQCFPDTFGDGSDFSMWALKATTVEMLDEAMRLIRERLA